MNVERCYDHQEGNVRIIALIVDKLPCNLIFSKLPEKASLKGWVVTYSTGYLGGQSVIVEPGAGFVPDGIGSDFLLPKYIYPVIADIIAEVLGVPVLR